MKLLMGIKHLTFKNTDLFLNKLKMEGHSLNFLLSWILSSGSKDPSAHLFLSVGLIYFS